MFRRAFGRCWQDARARTLLLTFDTTRVHTAVETRHHSPGDAYAPAHNGVAEPRE
jgi:hypothetical protein